MKRLLLPIALAVATAMPLAASAQQAPPQGPPGGGPPPMADRAHMRADMDQMRKLHDQFRAQTLGALSPEHRRLLASIAGSLAVAEHPDYRAAAQQLDAALSPSEKSAILAASKQMRDQMKQMRASMPHAPQDKRPTGQWAKKREHHEPTAGGILLGVAGGHGMMMGSWRR